MVILRSQNKITDFFMILAWASPFNSILQGTIYYFWELFFYIQLLLYVRQIQTFYLPKTAPTHEQ